jgi:hypothetical protein
MKLKRLFFVFFLFNSIVLFSCQLECPTRPNPVVDYTLNEKALSFYPYKINDTLKCLIGDQQNQTIYSVEVYDGVVPFKDIENLDCGTGTVYNSHFRQISYYNNLNSKVFEVELKAIDRHLSEFSFYIVNSNLNGYFFIGEYSFSFNNTGTINVDTLTINGKYYSDLFVQKNTTSNPIDYNIYYSKSKGLVRIASQNNIVFDLLD